jgi:uncharacterized protein YndB with AHSA1/START domain
MIAKEERTVVHSTLVIERDYPATAERVFAALADPGKKRRWLAEGPGRDAVQFEMDFRVGGRERTESRMKEGTPFAGTALVNETVYQDIVPNQRVVLAYTMSLGGRRISASLATFELLPSGGGTKLIFTDQGAYFEGSDGPERRGEGWRKLLDGLGTQLAG